MAWANIILFQFQNGAIKSKLKSNWPTRLCSFNSKMVRLKDSMSLEGNANIKGFNSKMVRLKGDNAKWFKILIDSFNSKMVRLKDDDAPILCRSLFEFQFQNGAIKSRQIKIQQPYFILQIYFLLNAKRNRCLFFYKFYSFYLVHNNLLFLKNRRSPILCFYKGSDDFFNPLIINGLYNFSTGQWTILFSSSFTQFESDNTPSV